MVMVTVKITILLVVDLCSQLAYFMMTQPLPIAGKLRINTLISCQATTNKEKINVNYYYLCNSIVLSCNIYYGAC